MLLTYSFGITIVATLFTSACVEDPGSGPSGPNPWAPRVLEFGSDVTQLTSGGSVTFRAFIADSNDDLLGGVLKDAGGATYGTFVGPGDDGTYELTITWDEIQAAASIDFETSQARTFAAEFFDKLGLRGEAEVTVTLSCGGDTACQGLCGKAACNGSCVDFDEDTNCGACGVRCLPGTCKQRVCSCETDENCPGSTQCFPDPTESPANQCQIVGATRVIGEDGTIGARSGLVEMELDGAWVPVCDVLGDDDDSIICGDLFGARGEMTITHVESPKGLVMTCVAEDDTLRYCDASIPVGGCTSQVHVVCGDTCTASCNGRECGDDGCGGSCGECWGEACIDGICGGCQPQCSARECGDDGCGGSCGTCPEGGICQQGDCRYLPPAHIHASGSVEDLEYAYYQIELRKNQGIRILASGSQWIEVLVRVGAEPTTDFYDAIGFANASGDVELDFEMPRTGTLHIGVFSIFATNYRIDTSSN